MGEVTLKEQQTNNEMTFQEVYIPYIEIGTKVQITYLDHSKIGALIEVAGKKKCKKKVYALILLVLSASIALGNILISGSNVWNYQKYSSHLWTLCMIVDLMTVFALFVIGQQQLIVYKEVVCYCNFKTKYRGSLSQTEYVKEDQGKHTMTIIMDGKPMIITSMDFSSNTGFREWIKGTIKKTFY